MSCYIVQEIDGTSRFTLEDSSGFLVLEDCVPTPSGENIMGGTAADALAQARATEGMQDFLKRKRRDEDDEDFLFLLTNL